MSPGHCRVKCYSNIPLLFQTVAIIVLLLLLLLVSCWYGNRLSACDRADSFQILYAINTTNSQ